MCDEEELSIVDLFEEGEECVVTLTSPSGRRYRAWTGAAARALFAEGKFVRGRGFEASVISHAASEPC